MLPNPSNQPNSQKPLTHLSRAFSPEGLANERQREYFCKLAMGIISRTDEQFQKINAPIPFREEGNERDAMNCLVKVWQGYDMGGHSMGRSERSVLLEGAIDHLRAWSLEEAKRCLALLLAMYYDLDYVTKRRWHDFQSQEFPYSSLNETMLLTIAWLCLDIEELPNTADCSAKDIYALAEKRPK